VYVAVLVLLTTFRAGGLLLPRVSVQSTSLLPTTVFVK
jgi:hypothetical protein